MNRIESLAIITYIIICGYILMNYTGGDIELFPPTAEFPVGLQLEHYDAQADLDRVIYQSSQTSCQGIEDFYTGDGFLSDWTQMKLRYIEVYQGGGDVMPPSVMRPNNGYDCSSFSHASHCLAELYSLDCEFYYKGHYGKIIPEDATNHVGICCQTAIGWKCD